MAHKVRSTTGFISACRFTSDKLSTFGPGKVNCKLCLKLISKNSELDPITREDPKTHPSCVVRTLEGYFIRPNVTADIQKTIVIAWMKEKEYYWKTNRVGLLRRSIYL